MSFQPIAQTYSKKACGICLDVLNEDVWAHVVHLKKHRFHGKCIAEWVNVDSSCPTCRAVVEKTSLSAYKTLLIEEDENLDFFPMELKNIYIFIAISGASFPIYDLMINANPIVIGAIVSLGTALIVRKIS